MTPDRRAQVFAGHRAALAILQRLMGACAGDAGPGYAILSSARLYLLAHDPERAWLTGRDRDTVQAEQEAAAPTLAPIDHTPDARPGTAALDAASRADGRRVGTCPVHGVITIEPGQALCHRFAVEAGPGQVAIRCRLTLTDGRD